LRRQADRIEGIESSKRSVFESQIMKLYDAVNLYQQLEVSLKPPGTTDFARELAAFQKSIRPGIAAMRARAAGKRWMATPSVFSLASWQITIPPPNTRSS
jgi:hypothetical protein